MAEKGVSTKGLILVPALITLAVTVLRLVGELQGWSAVLFNPAAGGGGAIVGIVWLVPIFGIYFALKLANAGQGPEKVGRVALMALLGVVIAIAAFFLVSLLSPDPNSLTATGIAIFAVASLIALFVQMNAWPALFKTLFAYGLAARIPVVIIMFLAIRGNWGTHYDLPPPNFPEMAWFSKFVMIGLIPQLTLWMMFTVVIGSLFGAIAVAIMHRGKANTQPA